MIAICRVAIHLFGRLTHHVDIFWKKNSEIMALKKSFQFCLKTMDYKFSCVNIIYILVKVFTNEKVNPPKNKLLNFHFTIFHSFSLYNQLWIYSRIFKITLNCNFNVILSRFLKILLSAAQTYFIVNTIFDTLTFFYWFK